jgi:hypothetical protein
MVDKGAQIHQPVIYLQGDAVAGQALGDALGHLKAGDRIFKTLYVAVWKCYLYHYNLTVV